MLHVVSFALLDSVNVLLIGVVVALGVILRREERYGRIATYLIVGDWLGVFLSSIPVLLLFDAIGQTILHLVESPLFGILLIAAGVVGAVMSWRGGDTQGLIAKVMRPLRTPTLLTAAMGMGLGAVQSLTSVPFFGGLAYLSASGLSMPARYITLVLYACMALSLPAAVAIAVGYVRHRPRSLAGKAFAWAREHQSAVGTGASYFVSVALIVIGISHLMSAGHP